MSQNLSVESLIAEFSAPETFDVTLPNEAVLTFRGFGSYAEKKAFEKDKADFVKQVMDAKNGAIKAADDDLIPSPFRPYSKLITPENLEAAFTIHRLCVSPGFSPADALNLTHAAHLIAYVLDQISWNSSNFLVNLKNNLYSEAKKD
jgi:hypothetical protein